MGAVAVAHFRRRIFLIDSKVQGALMIRVVAYWIYCLFTITMLLIWWDLFCGPSRRFSVLLVDVYQRFAPAAAASLLIVPLVVMDVLRLSNRFAGPARRPPAGLRDLGEGKATRPLLFRDSDFWQEMAADFNRVLDRVTSLASRTSRPQ